LLKTVDVLHPNARNKQCKTAVGVFFRNVRQSTSDACRQLQWKYCPLYRSEERVYSCTHF